MSDQLEKLEQRLQLAQQRAERYRAARDTAEELLERKASELYQTNQALAASRDNLEEDIKQATYELQTSNARLQKALDEKSNFIGSISHEVRTPLNAVVGLSELLLESEMSDEQEKYVRTIFESSVTLVKLLNDILHISKIEAGKVELQPYPTDIRDLLSSMCLMFTAEAAQRDVKLSHNVAADVPKWLLIDEARVGQIITNLVSNAIKNTECGTVHINASIDRDDGGEIRLRLDVIDTGVGIEQAQIRKIFSAYEQFGNLDQGVGLGLAICRQLSFAMQGELSCESVPGEGSTFTFSFPVEEAKDGELNQEPDPVDHDFSELHVLIAEDNEVNQQVIRAQFAQLGLVPMIVGNGQLALEEMESTRFDIVFLDIQMPVLDGEQTIQRIRNSKKPYAQTYCVALTAASFEQRREQLLELGFSEFVSKPMVLEDLRRTLRAAGEHPVAQDKSGESDSNSSPGEFSMEFFTSQFGESADLIFQQIAPVFLEHSFKELAELGDAVHRLDVHAIKKLSHSLKGAVASLGIRELADSFAAIEQDPEQAKLLTAFEHVSEAMETLKQQLIASLQNRQT